MKKIMILSKMTNKVTNLTGRTGLKISKYSPEILVLGGVIGIVASTVLACRATLKLDEVLEEAQYDILRIKENTGINEDKYSQADANKDLFTTYVQTGVKIGRLYLPAVTLSVLSIGSILCSYKIMKTRNVALMIAYKGVEEAFSRYRARVIEDVGADKDREYKYGVKKITETEMAYTDADGKKHKAETKTIEVLDGLGVSQYAKYFNETSKNHMSTPEYNLVFLRAQQQYANDILQSRGHIFLSEIYDMLGIKRTQESIIVGWVKGVGDNFVDFGIYDVNVKGFGNDKVNDTISEERIDFVNGYKNCILLDFNVAGVVYDQI